METINRERMDPLPLSSQSGHFAGSFECCRPVGPNRPAPVTVARYGLDSVVLPPVTDTLPLAEQVRRARSLRGRRPA